MKLFANRKNNIFKGQTWTLILSAIFFLIAQFGFASFARANSFSGEYRIFSAEIQLNDPGFTNDSKNTEKQWGLVKGGFLEAWKQTAGSSTTVIAIIDTGVDATHEDLRTINFVRGYNFLNKTEIKPGINSDDNGHGTLVAGVIGATPNNQLGIAGATRGISIMPLKALDDKGSGTSATVSEAVIWAADHGANIINLSIGGVGFSHDITLANAISYAFEKNVVIVAAAGNDVAITGGNLDANPVFPICDDNGQNMILGVTASDAQDVKPDFANFGKACVDVSAPGRRILSTINFDPVTKTSAPNAYAFASGTSLAAPFVSAQAALIKTLFPLATNKEVRDYIISSTDNIDALNPFQCHSGSCAGLIGSGRINAGKALEGALSAHSIKDGDVISVRDTGQLYYVNGGKKQLISNFVKLQRFASVKPKVVSANEIVYLTDGSMAEPLDETLIKTPSNPTVYYMHKGLKFPVTYQVFTMRKFNFGNVNVLSDTEIDSWLQGSFLAPPEGSLVKTPNNPTVYWVVGGVLHPVNRGFYDSRGLKIFPLTIIPAADLKSFSKGEAYISD